MTAPKKFEEVHQFLARLDNTPDKTPNGPRPGMWDRLVKFADERGMSRNDALNAVLKSGMRARKL